MSLILILIGTLLAVLGVGWILYQANTRQLASLNTAVWIYRAGMLAIFVAELVLLFVRPEGNLTFKVLLIGMALVVCLALAILPFEYQRPGLALERSLSWQAILLSLGLYLGAVMYIQSLVMAVGILVVWLGVRRARKLTATEAERRSLLNLAFSTQIGIIFITIFLLFL